MIRESPAIATPASARRRVPLVPVIAAIAAMIAIISWRYQAARDYHIDEQRAIAPVSGCFGAWTGADPRFAQTCVNPVDWPAVEGFLSTRPRAALYPSSVGPVTRVDNGVWTVTIKNYQGYTYLATVRDDKLTSIVEIQTAR